MRRPVNHANLWPAALLVGWAIAGAVTTTGSVGADECTQAQLLVRLARDDLEAGRLASGVDKLHQAQYLRPDWPVPHQWLALAYQAQGDEEAARAEYVTMQRHSLVGSSGSSENPADAEQGVIDCEALTMWLTNQTRQRQGQRLLLPDPLLSMVARQHSREMRELHYFSHTSPTEGKGTVMNRFEAVFGFRPDYIGENIGRRWGTGSNYLTAEKVTDTHHNFLSKPGHRRIVLYPEFNHIGVGIAVNDRGHYWLTEVMGAYPVVVADSAVVAKPTLTESGGGD